MHPYQPYYSPNTPLHLLSPTLPYSQFERERLYSSIVPTDILARRQYEAAVTREHSEAVARDQYTRSILMEDQVDSNLRRGLYDYTIDHQMLRVAESQVEYNYLKKIEELRRERQIMQNPGRLINQQILASLQARNCQKDERFMSDQELVHQYDSGYRGKGFRQEIKDRLTSTATGDKSHTKDPSFPEEIKRSHQKEPHSATRSQTAQKQSRKKLEPKKSYIQNLNRSFEGAKTIESAFKRSRKVLNKGHTIDVFQRTLDVSPLKVYLAEPVKKRSKKRTNRTINQSIRTKSKREELQSYRRQPPLSGVSQSGMERINNRLKVSEIVYKDSKLRHGRHQINHLFNTYENEAKIRKEIKDKINNHPSILKKHHLVAASR